MTPVGDRLYRTTPRVSETVSDSHLAETAISIRGLCKNYGNNKAVRGVDLDIYSGEIFGLIGPDGAGKTSIFQILGGVMQQTAGEAAILGRLPRNARPYIGYLTQEFGLYQDLSVRENLHYIGSLHKVSYHDIVARSERYLELFDMDRFVGRLVGALSGGMKQKLALICALVSEPLVLLLDEPTTGVDPVSRRDFWDTLSSLSIEGMTIAVATSYLDEAARCHRIALMHEGVFHQVGAPSDLRNMLGLKRLEVRASDIVRCKELISALSAAKDVQRFGDRIDVLVDDVALAGNAIRETLQTNGITLYGLRDDEPTLENIFVSTLGRPNGEVVRPTPGEYRAADGVSPSGVAIGGRNLNKHFERFQAVHGVTIDVKYGEIYGLLGANGAGKTTTIKMLCGLIQPTGGEVQLAGKSTLLRSRQARSHVGYMSQKFSLYDDLTVVENLEFFAGVYKVPRKTKNVKMEWVLSFAGLEGRGNMKTGKLPGGWKQRVAFGAAIMHEPSVLFLDEPTSGVDPLARRAFWRVINKLADSGVAILVTTHYLEEAEHCNRLGIMAAGKLLAEGIPTELKERQHGHLIEFLTDQPQRAANLLKNNPGWSASLFGRRLRVTVTDAIGPGISRVSRFLEEHGIRVIDAYEQPFSLEDVLIAEVEKLDRQSAHLPDS